MCRKLIMSANHRISGHFPATSDTHHPRQHTALSSDPRAELIEAVAAHLGSRARHAKADMRGMTSASLG